MFDPGNIHRPTSPVWKKRWSVLYPSLIDKEVGDLGHTLEVRLNNGKVILDTETANYSFGNLHKVFKRAMDIRPIPSHIDQGGEALILGFGAGSIANILEDRLKITGVEADRKVIGLYKKWFKEQAVRLIDMEAKAYLTSTEKRFDVIFVDLFIDTHVAMGTLSGDFIRTVKDHLRPKGCVYWNTMEVSDIQNLKDLFQRDFQRIKILEPVQGNHLFYLEAGPA
ncbi:MAG: hypothetical protein LPK28_02135 [Bacteroidota bacterium]|nr:hypothetical protein [Bacteroidota bacterium]